jgi:hypothetical protein
MRLLSHFTRVLALLLLILVPCESLAQAAAPAPPSPYDRFIQKLTARGTGHGIKVEEKDGTEIKGVLISFDSTGFQIIAPKAAIPTHIDYSQVKSIGATGMPTGARIAVGVLIGLVAVGVALLIALAVILR